MDILLCRADSDTYCGWHACLAIGHMTTVSSQILVEKLGF